MAAYLPAPRRGARRPRRGPPRAELAQGRRRARRRLPRRDHRRRHVGPARRRTGSQQAGVPFVIFEKNDDVGGTWLENTYPGCRVDNPNHNYSYSFAQRHDWPLHFSTQDVLLDYFRRCADAFGLREHMRFGTEVQSATWSEADRRWTVVGAARRRARGDGRGERRDQRGRPAEPPAVPRHRGPRLVRGPDASTPPAGTTTIDLRGKRVAVIGTGASAVQFIPEIAPRVGELLVFQRTPPWLGPTDDYHAAVEPGLRWLYAHVPSYSEWNRFLIFWKMGDGVLAGVTRRSRLGAEGRSVGLFNDILRQLLTGYLGEQFADRPDLLAKVVPTYPPGAKRLLRDNGVWAGALKRDNVQLVTDGDPRDHADGHRHRRRRRARRRRDHLRHRLPGVEVPHADEGHRPRRRRPARALGRRRARVPRRHDARVPEPLLPLRTEHEHRDQRQHHLLLRVRGAVHPRLPRAAPRGRAPRARRAQGRARRVQRARRRREHAAWRGAGPT